jgi:hypothetical protein
MEDSPYLTRTATTVMRSISYVSSDSEKSASEAEEEKEKSDSEADEDSLTISP